MNTDKIAKRPLSKNVYKKKVVVPKEEPSGPTTIIEKPEKDSKVGMVVAIILTIILGRQRVRWRSCYCQNRGMWYNLGMVGLAQMVRASDCGPEGHQFDPGISPQF